MNERGKRPGFHFTALPLSPSNRAALAIGLPLFAGLPQRWHEMQSASLARVSYHEPGALDIRCKRH